MKIGIVGLPNVGKSTLFNALTHSSQAQAANYPFCTIAPNVGVVDVPDARLQALARVSRSAKIIPAVVEFVDIAGLVKGAAEGAGLGNQFLAHIREVDAIVQVVRAFKDENVAHIAGKISPEDDKEIINMELTLADLASVVKALEKNKRDLKALKTREVEERAAMLEMAQAHLADGKPIRTLELNKEQKTHIRELHLLTAKPLLYVLNVDEDALTQENNAYTLAICAKIEAELAALAPTEAREYLRSLGLNESGLNRLTAAAYALLELITFFTSGEKETRAWTVEKGAKAPQAAGVIHSDFEKGFIRAEVANWNDFVECDGWTGLKEKGKMRVEGKEYEVKDGDVCFFRVDA